MSCITILWVLIQGNTRHNETWQGSMTLCLRLGPPCDHSVSQPVSLMLRHASERIAVQLVKLMCWSSRAKVEGGTPYGISLWPTWPDVCQMLVRLHSRTIACVSCKPAKLTQNSRCNVTIGMPSCGLTSSSPMSLNQKRYAITTAGARPRPAVQCTYTLQAHSHRVSLEVIDDLSLLPAKIACPIQFSYVTAC